MILDVKLTCPKCGCESAWKSFQVSDEIMEISRLAAKFGRNWVWCEEYLHSFRSSNEKPLKPKTMKVLIEEVQEFIEKQGFYYDRKFYAVRPDALYVSLRQVAMLNKMGFKNHNYLKKVAIDVNLKMIQKEEGEVQKKERELMDRSRRDPAGSEQIKKIMEGLK